MWHSYGCSLRILDKPPSSSIRQHGFSASHASLFSTRTLNRRPVNLAAWKRQSTGFLLVNTTFFSLRHVRNGARCCEHAGPARVSSNDATRSVSPRGHFWLFFHAFFRLFACWFLISSPSPQPMCGNPGEKSHAEAHAVTRNL